MRKEADVDSNDMTLKPAWRLRQIVAEARNPLTIAAAQQELRIRAFYRRERDR